MREHRTHVSNILIIGSGAAGLRAAIAAHEAGCDVVVVGKSLGRDAHTILAAGGINAVLGTRDPQDSWQQHFADTYKDAYGLSDPRMVEILAQESPRAVQELADWGVPFARTDDGQLDQRFFGAHTWRRTCYAGDYTGRAILHAIADRVDALGIPIHEGRYVARLLVKDDQCFGALAFDLHSGERTVYLADAVVLATGGHTRLWRRSSSRRDENVGDGLLLALEAGASIADMELVQFHPTGMVAPESIAGTLVTEAVRGEGGYLLNNQGERFMARYDAARMELSTRDRVALANYTEIIEGRGGANGGVFLDISHRDKDFILQKLPRMYRQFLEYQMLDISKQPMEVAPTAHYSMGGVVVEPETLATSVAGLFAAGEVSSGLHGANRLGGNSLGETVVFGRRAGEAAAGFSNDLTVLHRAPDAIRAAHDALDSLIKPGDEMTRPLQRAVRDTLWEGCGVVRDGDRLATALDKLGAIRQSAVNIDVRPSAEGWGDLALALDLRAGLAAAEATVRGAIARRESRGAHQRTDYPALDPALGVNFVVRLGDKGEQVLSQRTVPPVPSELQAYLDAPEVQVAGRLLE
ncbi:MAG: FAD-dependent oxidoreductase [Chloroflexota bacterium]|nr:FAD-dependent oxidoreductase [Chloroflexota bacterium]